MKTQSTSLALAAMLALGTMAINADRAQAGHYYSGWTYHPTHTYYYSYYHTAPTHYHTAIYYPAKPRYVYYYNPYRQVYWGRLDTTENKYSLLAEKDQKKDLKDIPEEAFPKPGELPVVPGAEDKGTLLPPKELPKIDQK